MKKLFVYFVFVAILFSMSINYNTNVKLAGPGCNSEYLYKDHRFGDRKEDAKGVSEPGIFALLAAGIISIGIYRFKKK